MDHIKRHVYGGVALTWTHFKFNILGRFELVQPVHLIHSSSLHKQLTFFLLLFFSQTTPRQLKSDPLAAPPPFAARVGGELISLK